ncbi:metallophosphoesterase family protein [Thermodesulfobacteriota bacterium]
MRIAIVSDIHGNMEAFGEVLSDIDKSDVDTIVSVGDNIGYGPEPERVLEHLRNRNIPSVMGNHELAVADNRIAEQFNPLARKSINKTIEILNDDEIDYVRQLDYFTILHGYRFVHGFPPDSVVTYLFRLDNEQLQVGLEQYEEALCFVGHTHIPEIVTLDNDRINRGPLPGGLTELDPNSRYIINCGSVGQPRDLNNNAKYVILDTDAFHIDVRHIPYDISSVADKILAAGLPEAHANRLW